LQTNYDAIGVDAFKSDLKKFLMYKAVVDMQVTAKTDDDQGDDDGGEE
jgi:hypothetical protein